MYGHLARMLGDGKRYKMIIKKDLLSHRRALEIGRGLGNPKKYIAVHQTGNPGVGADAAAHAKLQKNETLNYGWHWQVDDKQAIQSFSHDYKIYCQGDGFNGIGNNQAISVEICINKDGNYNKAVENGARLIAQIMKDEKIGIDNVQQHNFFSGKNCPAQIRAGKNGITWKKFKQMVMSFYGEERKVPVIAKTKNLAGDLYRVTTDYLNIRKGPSTSYAITGVIKDNGTYTIVETVKNWGRLKSGKGWIYLGYTSKVEAKKSAKELAKDIALGRNGFRGVYGKEREKKVTAMGYNYNEVKGYVNEIVKGWK